LNLTTQALTYVKRKRVNVECDNCRHFEKEFYVSESKWLNLAYENIFLRRQLKALMPQNPVIMT
jgi:hypothetical protein